MCCDHVTVSDGKLRCARCLRSFGRERHFKTHRCLATIGYVDIAAKEMLEEADGMETSGDILAVGQDGVSGLPSTALWSVVFVHFSEFQHFKVVFRILNHLT